MSRKWPSLKSKSISGARRCIEHWRRIENDGGDENSMAKKKKLCLL